MSRKIHILVFMIRRNKPIRRNLFVKFMFTYDIREIYSVFKKLSIRNGSYFFKLCSFIAIFWSLIDICFKLLRPKFYKKISSQLGFMSAFPVCTVFESFWNTLYKYSSFASNIFLYTKEQNVS